MRRALSLTSLAGIVALSLTGCGEDGAASGTSASGASTSTSTTGAGGAGTTSTTGATTSSTGGAGGGAPGGLFAQPNAWTKDVSGLGKSAESDAIIATLIADGGWGHGDTFQIDFGLEVLAADMTTPTQAFAPTDEFYSPDCDEVPFPIPSGGAIEAESGYACEGDGDCHLLVVQQDTRTLFEMWRANLVGGTFEGGCAAVWDLDRIYPENLRGEGCTSADAGGFPITAMLASADEVFAGTIDHALRFILPNDRIRDGVYVHPGTHSTFPTAGGPTAPPYGVRFRLRADYPLETLPSEGARVIARAIQTYGMFLADGGNIALTLQSDRFTAHKWADLGVDSHALYGLAVADMEVVDMGAPITWDGNCVRNP